MLFDDNLDVFSHCLSEVRLDWWLVRLTTRVGGQCQWVMSFTLAWLLCVTCVTCLISLHMLTLVCCSSLRVVDWDKHFFSEFTCYQPTWSPHTAMFINCLVGMACMACSISWKVCHALTNYSHLLPQYMLLLYHYWLLSSTPPLLPSPPSMMFSMKQSSTLCHQLLLTVKHGAYQLCSSSSFIPEWLVHKRQNHAEQCN